MVNTVLLVTNIPTPYRIPLFNELNKQLQSYEIKLIVIFGAMGYSRRKWIVEMSECEFAYKVLSSRDLYNTNPEKSSFTYPGLYRLVSEEKPLVIISNGFSVATTKLWIRSWFRQTPYLIWSGDIHHPSGAYNNWVRRLQRKLLIQRAEGFIAYGTSAKKYLVSLGAPAHKVQVAINTVDTAFFASLAGKLRENRLHHDGDKRLLYVGHFSTRKNVLRLLTIIKHLSKFRSDFKLDIVGDGEEYAALQRYVNDNSLINFVEFHGYKQQSEIPLFMAKAGCFLFQSDFDIWGLVLNEAMAFGLLCLASVNAGATQDLIKDRVTGFAVDFAKTEEVANRINWVLENPHIADQIGQNACRFIMEHASLEKSVSGFVKAITRTIANHNRAIIPKARAY